MRRSMVGLGMGVLLLASPMAFAGGHWHHGHGYYWRGYGHHYYDDDAAAFLLGGLLVGGLVTHAYYTSRPPAYTVPYPSTVVYRETTYPAPVVVTPGRHLLRDLEGRCYERTIDGNGNELRTELPASECNW